MREGPVIIRVGSPVLIVGQAPARTDDPTQPLTGRTGDRLRAFMGCSYGWYKENVDRCNLLPEYPGPNSARSGDKWYRPAAVRAAACIVTDDYEYVILLGRNVEKAWGLNYLSEWFQYQDVPSHGTTYIVVPHPSGRSRWWNSEDNRVRASIFWQNIYHLIHHRAMNS